MTAHPNTNTTFDSFMKAVDLHMTQLCGLTTADFTDYNYHQAHRNRESPQQVARDAFKAAWEAL